MKQSAFVEALKFASHAMAKKDVRYYLNGVLFEFRGSNLTLVGTDGHRMAYVELDDVMGGPIDCDVIVPGDTVKLMLTAFKAASTGYVSFELTRTDKPEQEYAGRSRVPCFDITVTGSTGQQIKASGLDGKFPDWRRVCKADDTPKAVESIAFNSAYIAEAARACGALAGRYAGATFTFFESMGGCRVTPSNIDNGGILSAACVVMPMRT